MVVVVVVLDGAAATLFMPAVACCHDGARVGAVAAGT